MNAEQLEAFDAVFAGKNVFITGSAGTGKSYTLREIMTRIDGLYVSSTTGLGAAIINGQTIHSLLKIGLGDRNVKEYIMSDKVQKRVKKISKLIIDEISMMRSDLFDKINKIFKTIKKNDKPFGGIQIIVSGDFLQLPPVKDKNYCFDSDAWKELKPEIIHLKIVMRQDNAEFVNYLQNIRVGNITQDLKDYFTERLVDKHRKRMAEEKISPITLTSLKNRAAAINRTRLNQLAAKNPVKKFHIKINRGDYQGYIKPHVEETLELAVGAEVILIANLDVRGKLVNGAKGKILSFENNLPVVRFGKTIMTVTPYTWEVRENKQLLYSYSHIPLILGYAITIHKSQGMTLEAAALDLEDVFSTGQIYVAFSRVRNIENLYIFSVKWDKIMCDDYALEFYKNI